MANSPRLSLIWFMNTPHERLTRTTFSLPFGEVHALVGGAVNARPILFLHGFPEGGVGRACHSVRAVRLRLSGAHGVPRPTWRDLPVTKNATELLGCSWPSRAEGRFCELLLSFHSRPDRNIP